MYDKYTKKPWKNVNGIIAKIIPDLTASEIGLPIVQLINEGRILSKNDMGRISIVIRNIKEEEFIKIFNSPLSRYKQYWHYILFDDMLCYIHQRFLEKV